MTPGGGGEGGVDECEGGGEGAKSAAAPPANDDGDANPKPYTQDPKPQTPNPEPQTLSFVP